MLGLERTSWERAHLMIIRMIIHMSKITPRNTMTSIQVLLLKTFDSCGVRLIAIVSRDLMMMIQLII